VVYDLAESTITPLMLEIDRDSWAKVIQPSQHGRERDRRHIDSEYAARPTKWRLPSSG